MSRLLSPAKPAATAAAPADASSIPAVLPRATDCGHSSSQQDGAHACHMVPESTTEACAATASAAPCLSLDLELSPDEVRG